MPKEGDIFYIKEFDEYWKFVESGEYNDGREYLCFDVIEKGKATRRLTHYNSEDFEKLELKPV